MYRRKVPAVSTSEGCAVAQPRAAGVRGQRGVSVGSWVHLERRWSGSRLRRWGPGTLAHACCACHAGRWGCGVCVQADTLHVQFFVLRSSAVAVSAAQPAAVGACGKRPLWQVFLWSFEEFMAVDWSGRL